LRLLDRVSRIGSGLCGGCDFGDLQHRRDVGALSMLYKVAGNPSHSLHPFLPGLHRSGRVTRGSTSLHGRAFEIVRIRTTQFSRCFIQRSARLWNGLGCGVFDSGSLVGFKSAVHRCLSGI
jgi:hypothetical protein